MKMIKVSDATYQAIVEEATLPFRSTGTRQADGTWLVPIADDTWERREGSGCPARPTMTWSCESSAAIAAKS